MKRANDEVKMETANKKQKTEDKVADAKSLELSGAYEYFLSRLIAAEGKNAVPRNIANLWTDVMRSVPRLGDRIDHEPILQENWDAHIHNAQLRSRQRVTFVRGEFSTRTPHENWESWHYDSILITIHADGKYEHHLRIGGGNAFFLDDIEDAVSYEPVCRMFLENEYSALVGLMPTALWKLVRDYWSHDLRLIQ